MTDFKHTTGGSVPFGALIAMAQAFVGNASSSISSVTVIPPAADGASMAAQAAFQAAASLYGSNIEESLSTAFSPLEGAYDAVSNALESQEQQASSTISSTL